MDVRVAQWLKHLAVVAEAHGSNLTGGRGIGIVTDSQTWIIITGERNC